MSKLNEQRTVSSDLSSRIIKESTKSSAKSGIVRRCVLIVVLAFIILVTIIGIIDANNARKEQLSNEAERLMAFTQDNTLPVNTESNSLHAKIVPISTAVPVPNETGNNGNDISPVIGRNEAAISLTLSEYVAEYNATLRRTVSSSVNTNVSDSDYIGCAKTLINKALKNPSAAQYNSARVYEKDSYGRAIVYLDVSAQNSFGGWVRSEYYVCIQSCSSNGTFTYRKTAPYTDDKSAYDILLLMNDFGEDPADEELEGMLFEYADFVNEEPSFVVSPSQSLNCYKLVFDYGIQFVYVDTTTNKVVSVQTAFTNASGHASDCEKICAASIAALTDTSMSTAKENIANVMSFSSFSPTSTPAFYNDGFVYDCAYGFSGVDMAVTVASEDSYKSGLYWSPNNEEVYYENLADEYAENKDFDNAIVYYEQAQIGGDKLNAAYYGKAEQSFADGDLDTAGLYFGYAGNYKDAAVRVLEVFYSAGQKHEKNKDYNSAIYSYSMAGDYSDAKTKYKECNFKQGELDMSNKQYLEAATCFEAAADYSGANEKYKESCYLYAEQQLLTGSTDTAATYFKKAGDYKDAATRMQKYYYDKGTEHLASKEYLEAADAFKQIMDYSDASDKYKEANYLYGEKMLEQGNVESAKTYFYNASGYSDADTRVQRYYYEAGEALLKSGEYLSAVDKYSLAGNYSDAPTKILECYYQYGNKQLSLNYITEATTYLSKCRGYKDTDDILLGYYYGEATKAVKVLMDAFPAKTFTATVDNAYKDAKNKLVRCEGYKDSATLITIVEKLYYVWTEMQFESNWAASLYEMTASYSGDIITITKSNFMTGTSCTLFMTHNVKNNTFSADITHMFNLSAREYDVRKVVSAMLVLFTDIENTIDFDAKFSNESNWTISGDNEAFTMAYGGYNISVQTKPEDYGYIDCSISVTTNNDKVEEAQLDWDTIYSDKIAEYRQALAMGVDAFEEKYGDGYDYSSINALMVRYSYYHGSAIGYTITDIDENGVAELIFSDLDSIIDIYTVRDGSVIKLFEECYFGERNRLHVLTTGRLLAEGSDGASSASCEIYRIDDPAETLSLSGAYYCDGYGPSLYMDRYTYMSEDEYYDMVNNWIKDSIFATFNWTVIAENPEFDYDYTEPDTEASHTHSFGSWTNSNNTSHVRSCFCGEKEIKAHTYDSGKVTKEPTTTATGVKIYTCTTCKAAKTETIPKLEVHLHSYGNWYDYGSTHSRSCSCGDTETEMHSWNSGTVTKEPTTSSNGTMTYICTECGATETDTIPQVDTPEETSKPETQGYDYQCICNYCGHDDGVRHLVLYNGVKTDVIWTCSACGKENWNYIAYSW